MHRRPIKNTSKGESATLFPFLFLFLTICPEVYAFELSDFFYSFLNFPQERTISIEEIQNGEIQIDFRYDFENIYRAKIKRKSVVFSHNLSPRAGVLFPFHFKNSSQMLSIDLNRNQFLIDTKKDVTAIVGKTDLSALSGSFRWAATKGIGLIGVGIDYSIGDLSGMQVVNRFPISAKAMDNEFFFDWLEPAFGRNFSIESRPEKLSLLVWGSTPLNAAHRLGLSVSQSDFSDDIQIHYVNSSNKPQLTGNRRIDVPVSFKETLACLSLNSQNRTLNCIEAGFILSRGQTKFDNNQPTTLDYRNLGNGDLARDGFFINSVFHFNCFRFSAGLSYGKYSMHLLFRLPVLGYYQELFPISHAVDCQFKNSSSFAQKIGGDYRFDLWKFNNSVSLTYTHARYNYWIDGEADLEFGLVMAPLHYPLRYDVNLFDLVCSVNRQIGKVGIHYQFRQLVPVTNRLDDSPVYFVSPTEKYKKNLHGGQLHEFNINYSLN